MVELTRFEDAAQARVASRALLAAGLHAEVRRDGGEHVVQVDPGEVDQACAMLGLDVDVVGLPAGGEPEVLPEPDPAAASVPAAEPELESVESIFGAGLTTPAPAPEIVVDDDDLPEPELESVESIFGAGLTTPAPAPETVVDQDDLPASPDGTSEPGGTNVPDKVRRPDIDSQGYAVIALVASEEVAAGMAAMLLEAGIGVDLVDADTAGYGAEPVGNAPSSNWVVRVLPTDTDRALEVLGLTKIDPPRRTRLVEGVEVTTVDGEEVREYLGGRIRLTRRQVIAMVIIYVLALIFLPLFFFWATQEILDPDIPTPVPTLPGGTMPDIVD